MYVTRSFGFISCLAILNACKFCTSWVCFRSDGLLDVLLYLPLILYQTSVGSTPPRHEDRSTLQMDRATGSLGRPRFPYLQVSFLWGCHMQLCAGWWAAWCSVEFKIRSWALHKWTNSYCWYGWERHAHGISGSPSSFHPDQGWNVSPFQCWPFSAVSPWCAVERSTKWCFVWARKNVYGAVGY